MRAGVLSSVLRIHFKEERVMPSGKGTYGTKVGRPPKQKPKEKPKGVPRYLAGKKK